MTKPKRTAKAPARGRRIAQEPRSAPTATPSTPHDTPADRGADRLKHPPGIGERARRAAALALQAEVSRAGAEDNERLGDFVGARFDRAEAVRCEAAAVALTTLPSAPVRGIGGEMALEECPPNHPARAFKNTMETPSSTTAAASQARHDQLAALGPDTVAQGLDAAETVGARDSLERMASHQLAAAHGLAMQLLHDGAEELKKRNRGDQYNNSTIEANDAYCSQGCRLLAAAARLMATFQSGHATLARIKQGGRQVVTVQHVNVEDGGQAVVAGTLGAGSPGGGQRGEGK